MSTFILWQILNSMHIHHIVGLYVTHMRANPSPKHYTPCKTSVSHQQQHDLPVHTIMPNICTTPHMALKQITAPHSNTGTHTHTECICTIICTYVWWLFGNWPHLIMGCISYVAWFIAEQGCWSWGTCLTWHVGGPWVRDEFETTPQFYWAAYLWTFNDGYWCYKYVPHIGCHSSMVATSVEDWMEHST